jgi:hypothetical protein
MANGHFPEPFLLLAAFVLVLMVARAWKNEFLTLMGLADSAFPGRYDKPTWVFLMVVVPPLGLVAFRSFRKTYWLDPAEAAAPSAAKPAGVHELEIP